MALYRPKIQQGQINATDTTLTFNLNFGEGLPENIHLSMKVSAMSGSETLDITGRRPGAKGGTYETAVLVTQIDINAAASTVISSDLSAKVPLDQILLTSASIAAAETIDVTLITW